MFANMRSVHVFFPHTQGIHLCLLHCIAWNATSSDTHEQAFSEAEQSMLVRTLGQAVGMGL